MDKKTVATTILSFLILIFLACVGATISTYGVEPQKVEVKQIKVVGKNGIIIKDDDGKEITELEVKSSSVGVRPSTGEEDSVTSIPTTVNDQVGTEGAYATFKLSSNESWKIILNSCTLTSGVEENLENVRIAIMEKDAKAINGAEKGAILYEGEPVQDKCFVVVVWLDKDTTKTIVGADISIEIDVVGA